MILGVKLSRRLVASVGLEDETFVYRDSRYLTSSHKQGDAMQQYFGSVLARIRPVVVYYFAPPDAGPVTTQLIHFLESSAANLQITVKPVTKFDLYGSLSLAPPQSREQVLAVITDIWPDITESKPARRSALAEAATAALWGGCLQEWPRS